MPRITPETIIAPVIGIALLAAPDARGRRLRAFAARGGVPAGGAAQSAPQRVPPLRGTMRTGARYDPGRTRTARRANAARRGRNPPRRRGEPFFVDGFVADRSGRRSMPAATGAAAITNSSPNSSARGPTARDTAPGPGPLRKNCARPPLLRRKPGRGPGSSSNRFRSTTTRAASCWRTRRGSAEAQEANSNRSGEKIPKERCRPSPPHRKRILPPRG